MQIYQCDVCGRHCSRIHCCEAYGIDTGACDDCYHYEWSAYDEPADPLLYPKETTDASTPAA